MKLLLSLHDVAPVHLDALERVEALFRKWGFSENESLRLSYLLVPDFHGLGRSDSHPRFLEFCQRVRPWNIDWCLHGYFHMECEDDFFEQHSETRPPGDAVRPSASSSAAWVRRLTTGGEAEFASLKAPQAQKRIRKGKKVFEACLGFEARNFVAPMRSFNRDLIPVLRDEGFAYTEDHRYVYDLKCASSRGAKLAPVVTWQGRNSFARLFSRLSSRLTLRRSEEQEFLRVTIHPNDFDHPGVVDEIRRLLMILRQQRSFIGFSELESPEQRTVV